MNSRDQQKAKINVVAEIHHLVYPMLKKTLKQMQMTEYGKKMYGGAPTYFEWWIARSGDKFFEMSTFVRLGSAAETAFRDYYMVKKSLPNLMALKADRAFTKGVFQRVISRQNTLQALYREELGIDLAAIPEFKKVQEFYVHRHLYAHSSGVIDDVYLADLDQIGGQPRPDQNTLDALGYPVQDVYWFEPLSNLSGYFEDFNRLFNALP